MLVKHRNLEVCDSSDYEMDSKADKMLSRAASQSEEDGEVTYM